MELVILDSYCCGIAGTYGFKKENYQYSQGIGEPLFDLIREVNPDVVASDCETCKWQIDMSTDYTVINPISRCLPKPSTPSRPPWPTWASAQCSEQVPETKFKKFNTNKNFL